MYNSQSTYISAPTMVYSSPTVSYLSESAGVGGVQLSGYVGNVHSHSGLNQLYGVAAADGDSYLQIPKQTTPQVIAPFLHSIRPRTRFVGCSEEVISLVHSIFTEVTGRELTNVDITISSPKEMKKVMPHWHPGILGFARNANGGGVHQIYVAEDYLDSVILTIGHEIGHVVSKSLPDIESEEAKAFAFEVAWARAIKHHDFGGLANSISIHEPAHNGVHDVALAYVFHQIRCGRAPLDIYDLLAMGKLKVGRIETLCN